MLHSSRTHEDAAMRRRARALAVFFIVAFVALSARLYHLQLVEGASLADRARANFARKFVVPAHRGDILDRAGRPFATNRPSFNVYITPYFFHHPQEELDLLRDLLGLSNSALARIVEELARPAKFARLDPFLAVEDIGRDEVALLESAKLLLPGVHVAAVPRREYPMVSRAAHLIGYMNEVNDADLTGDGDMFYRPGDLIGRHGIEKAWEPALRGLKGSTWLIRDARGFVVEDRALVARADLPTPVEPAPGASVVLSIDSELQEVMERAFERYRAGAAVAVEVHTGRVLGMYSKPSYDLNRMWGKLTYAEKALLDSDPDLPQIDRTLYQRFPPGSTFKVVTALAALQEGVIDPEDSFFCPGFYKLGTHTFRCHARGGHGAVALRRALIVSCDVYFWHLSELLGLDTIAAYSRNMGLGEPTGIGVNDEVPGIVPDREWYDSTAEGFRPGHTANVSIGQGALSVTTLQMAMLYAAIANGGKLLRPTVVDALVDSEGRLLETYEPVLRRWIEVDPLFMSYVNDALVGVTHSAGGTALGAAWKYKDRKIAGKTGTAQTIISSFGENDPRAALAAKKKGEKLRVHKSHAWFTSYAPYDDPRIAVAVIVEHGGGGGAHAAPVAMKIIDGWFDIEDRRLGMASAGFPIPRVGGKPAHYKVAADSLASTFDDVGLGPGRSVVLGGVGDVSDWSPGMPLW